jgi:spermidine synthase
MLKGKSGDSAIGKIYAWNTVGSILGVIFAIQLVMPLMGLKWVIGVGALVDVLLGLYIIRRAQISLARYKPQLVLVTISLFIILSIPFLGLDTQKMASGVYRYGLSFLSAGDVIFHADGKTSTVAVKKITANNRVSLLNNGKPDAALNMSSSTEERTVDRISDEPTMVLAGTLPYVYKPDASSIANIGLGSGLTAHVLLHNKELKRLDTIEIEEAVYKAARFFLPRVENLYEDPRSNVIIEDAKTYFATSGHKYDVIVSEPSNPWVSGVSGLFSTEFYHEIKRYLKPNGILVQWVQLYEISPELIASIYLALKENFADIHLYQIATFDVAIVAGMDSLEADYNTLFKHGELENELEMIQVKQPSDLAFRKLAEKDGLDIVFSSLAGAPNSDYFPILDIGAAKARFTKNNARSINMFYTSKVLKSLVDDTSSDLVGVTETPAIEATMLLNEMRYFHRLLKQYSESDSTPLITTSRAEGTAKKLSEIISHCKSNQAGKWKDVISKQIIDIGQWAYDYSKPVEMRQLFKKIGGCRHRLNENGSLWLDAHLAWLDGDLPKVLDLTKKYLDNQQSISTSADKLLLKFNIVSHIQKGTGADIYKYYEKAASATDKDLELRGLLYRFDPSIIIP